jgi:hypothetical protein
MKRLTLLLAAVALLPGCDAINLLNSAASLIAPNGSASASPTPAPGVNAASPTPTPLASIPPVEVVAAADPTPLSSDWNLARLPGVVLQVSSTMDPTFGKDRLIDGKLTTSWFATPGDAAAQGKLPTIEMSFPQPVGILGINLRGHRERNQGLQIQEMSVLISSAQGVLLNQTVTLPAGHSDYNIVLKRPVDAATSLRLTVTRDSIPTPGLAEIEVVGRPQ